jgi:hypothetical protein
MPEDLSASRAEGKAPMRDLGWSFAAGLVIAVSTFFLAVGVASLISPLFPSPLHEVADAIVVIVTVYWVLVAAEVIAGVVVRTALGRPAVGNALLIAALLSAAFLLILGILVGAC